MSQAKHAPLPWHYSTSVTASNNGAAHVYIVDANGRKIAAIWGPWEEKMETAQLILDKVNGQ